VTTDVAKGLANFLTQQWDEEVRVDGLTPATAGARRHNVLFDAHHAGKTTPLCATITPNAAVQVMGAEVEASCLQFAEAAGAPAPHVHGVSSDPSFAGGPFFITSRIDGETIPRRVLRLIEAHPGLGERLGHQCGEALARLHGADTRGANDALARPDGVTPSEQALRGADLLFEGLLQPSLAFRLAFQWLERNQPPPPQQLSLVHGDFRNGNLIVGEDGLRAALDWELTHIGDPMEDLGWMCQRMWRFRNDSLEVGGFAGRDALRAGYEAAGGTWNEASFHWWKTMGTLRWGMGLAGQAAAHINGAVRSIVMAASGRRVAELEYDTLMLLRSAFESEQAR
jgi:aminoglycoside phosphotransferase (APT) family kinase protein